MRDLIVTENLTLRSRHQLWKGFIDAVQIILAKFAALPRAIPDKVVDLPVDGGLHNDQVTTILPLAIKVAAFRVDASLGKDSRCRGALSRV